MKSITQFMFLLWASLSVYTVGAAPVPKADLEDDPKPVPVTRTEQLHGCYKRINFTPKFSKIVNPEEYWPGAHQWYCFEKNGKVGNMTSSEDKPGLTADALRQILSSIPNTPDYQLITKGVLRYSFIEPKASHHWQVTLIQKNIQTPDGTIIPKGTLVMGLINPETDKIVYWRYLAPMK